MVLQFVLPVELRIRECGGVIHLTGLFEFLVNGFGVFWDSLDL